MATECSLYGTISIIHKEYYPKNLHESLKPLNLRPDLYVST
jgi:hypothetical protein